MSDDDNDIVRKNIERAYRFAYERRLDRHEHGGLQTLYTHKMLDASEHRSKTMRERHNAKKEQRR